MASPISLKIGTNTKRDIVTIDSDKTPKQALDERHIDYSKASLTLDGVPLGVKDMNTSFAELGVTDEAFLIAVTKTDNAQ